MDLLSALPALLPAATFLGICYAVRPLPSGPNPSTAVVAPLRLAVVRAAVVVGAYAVIGVEVLSALGTLDATGDAVLWSVGVAAAGTGAVLRYRRDPRPPRPARPRWSPITFLMALGLVVLAGLTLTVAVASAPNNWDSQSYHLPRIEQWVQNGSVGLFPSGFFSQNDLAPGAELLLLNLRLLTGGDRLYNLVQWSAAVLCGVAASRVAAQLGARRVGQVGAAFFFLSAPMVVLQASSTQTDLVAAGWAAAAATLAVDAAWGRPRLTGALLLGAAAGLAQDTKATGALAAWPMVVLWLAVRGWRALGHRSDPGRAALGEPARGPALRRLAGSVAVLVLAALVIAGPFLARMTVAYGSPLGPQVVRDHSMQRHDPPAVVVNAARLLQTASMLPSTRVDRWTAGVVERMGRAIGAPADDPAITEGTPFPVGVWAPTDEDLAAFPVHVAAGAVAVGYCLIRRWRDRRVLGYTLACLLVLIAFAAELKWQRYVNRLLLPGLVVSAPLVGVAIDALLRRSREWSRVVTAAALSVLVVVVANTAVRTVIYGRPRALAGPHSVLAQTAWQQRFDRIPQALPDYDWATGLVRAAGAHRVGLVIDQRNRWEYPLWVALRGRTLVSLVSDVPGHPAPPVTSVDAIVCELPGPPDCAALVPPGWVLRERTWLAVALPPGR